MNLSSFVKCFLHYFFNNYFLSCTKRFYNQNGSKLKVDYFNQSGRTYAANGVDAVISGEGNKFTIFFLNKERDLVALSGEFTGDAIKDFQQSVINKVEEPIGTVRVFKSKSGYAESTREF